MTHFHYLRMERWETMNENVTLHNNEEIKFFGMEYFKVSQEILRKVFAEALAKGADYADLFFEHTTSSYLALTDGKVHKAYSNVDFGVGIRVIYKEKTGYAFTENICEKELLHIAKIASQIATNPQSSPAYTSFLPPKSFHNFYPVKTSWEGISTAEKMPFMQKLNEKIFSKDNRVKKVQVYLSDSNSRIFFVNSEGVSYTDFRPLVSLGAVCVMKEGEKLESARVGKSYRMGYEFLTEERIENIAQEAIDKTSILFKAIRGKGGEMPVVLGAGSSGILLHEAIGHAFEADFNRKNESIFSNQLHQKICNEHINVVDDATLQNYRGSLNIDDEGISGEKTYIVREGVLNSYLYDRISAKHYKVPYTGNGRRESFRNYPLPRMRSTYMENGDTTEEELIKEVKRGIYCDTFTNGQVQIGAGDFTFFVKSGYLIEEGKLTQPLKDINIIGNGPQALADITLVANNLQIDDGTWMCGKGGQSVPVSQGMPSVLVKSLVVGGTN
ncbi:MAG TPA: peptidase U62 [Porphyromonadaceae bacterium]|nr:peptidase U62 [Porphyromonadaceae bacterium]